MYLGHWYTGSSLFVCFTIEVMLRHCLALHHTFIVNSIAHKYGSRPYDPKIEPRDNYFVVYLALGEGYHNYHHTFPWDYSTSELGWRLNLTTIFINTMAFIGQAYDLKQVSPEMIIKRKLRTGDTDTHGNYGLYNPPMMKESTSLHHRQDNDKQHQH